MLEIKQQGATVEFSGELNCNTVVKHWPFKLLDTLPKQAEFNLGKLRHVDTAGLAWLLQQLAQANKKGIVLRFTQIPTQLHNLAAVSDVLPLLPTD